MQNKELEIVVKHLKEKTGFDFSNYKEESLLRRLNTRLKSCGHNNLEDYINFLINDSSETEKLLDVFLIKVTQFFRDIEAYKIFKEKVLYHFLEEKLDSLNPILRIWSIGCATGEEPYSIAILIYDYLKENNRLDELNNIQIYATELSETAIKAAKNGVYHKNSLVNLPVDFLNKYFIQINGDNFMIIDEIKKMVKFGRHCIVSGDFYAGFDIIVCRNLFIYFKKKLQEQLFYKLYNSLNVNGVFWLGKSEALSNCIEHKFRAIDRFVKIYQKIKSSDKDVWLPPS